MADATPHSHAKVIAEWLLDTSREIEAYRRGHSGYFQWNRTTIDLVLRDIKGVFEIRFADAARQKHQVVSSLTDYDILSIVEAHNPSHDDVNLEIIRAVANAAAAKENADIAKKQSLKFRDTPSSQPQNFNDYDVITPEKMASLYQNTAFKHRTF